MAYTERYTTVAGGGAHDGTSEANAWTWAEMRVVSHSPGDKINIKAGSYGTVTGFTSPAGDATQQIIYSGYNSVIDDLDNQGNNADGSLNTTNFPTITLSSIITPAVFNVFQNLLISASLTTAPIYTTANDGWCIKSCLIIQTGTGYGVRGDNAVALIGATFRCTNTSHNTVADFDRFPSIQGCRFEGTEAGAILLNFEDGVVDGNAFSGPSDAIAITFTGNSALTTIKNNTVYGCGTAIRLPNIAVAFPAVIMNNHITDNAVYIDNPYSATANNVCLEVNNRTRDNTVARTGIGDNLRVGEVTTDTGGWATDYVDAPNGDITLIPAAPAIDSGLGM